MIDINLMAKIRTKMIMSQDKPDNVENIETLTITSSKKCMQSMLRKFLRNAGKQLS